MALLAADFTGVWSADLAPSIPFRLSLQQTSDSVSGSQELGGRIIPIENARVEGESLTFTISVPAAGRLQRLPLTAVLKDDHLRLVIAGQELILNRVNPNPEDVRVERLAATIRLWGTIKFFHPYVAYRPIDWDAALIAAIQQVNHAANPDDFSLALAGMLAKLDDPETRVLGIRELDPRPVPCQCRAIVRSRACTTPSDSTPYYADWENVGQREPYIMRFAGSIRVAIRTAEPVPPSGAGINMTDKPYAGDLPSREYRLLALARYWNAIQYFYGYPGSLESWNSALTEFIPQFEHSETSRDYLFTLSRLASRTHDGHSFLGGFTGSVLSSLGKTPDVSLRNLAGQIVVTASASQSLQPGDVIKTVNRKPVLENEKFLLTLIPHSTPHWGALAADRFLLAGPEPTVNVGVRKGGKEEELELTGDVETVSVRPAPALSEVFGKLPSGLGYIDLRELQAGGVDRAFDELMDTPGLILDLRGSASAIFTQLAARLTSGKPVAAARTRQRVWHGPNPQAVTEDTLVQYAYPGGKPAYPGPVAVLIDARAFSAAEHTALFLRTAANAVFVGSPTSGTNGNITHLILPGAIQANFAAMEISHPDGAPLQRVGILPDVWVEPTVKGIQQGRDEVLERAVELLTRK